VIYFVFCESQIRQVELQFTIGEALSCAGAGRLSQAALDPWTVQLGSAATQDIDPGVMKDLIEMIVTKHSKNPIPHARQVNTQKKAQGSQDRDLSDFNENMPVR
jgi:proteasome component ECM29